AADQGTLLLDEVGDLKPAAQAALLRVLQEREVLPVGSTRAIPVDVRVVTATHRDVEQLVTEEKFREDLQARLSGVTVRLPPLLDRREDIGILVAALLRRIAPERAEAVTFSADAMRVLLEYRWPQNIRELEKCLSFALLQAREGRVELQD